ncbi:MAG TPA: cupin domain-containing protein [Candidatus Dormibacteraeota bacterium]
MEILEAAGRYAAGAAGAPGWVEHLRVADLSLGTYSLPAGGVDNQEPHTEDEIYVVMSGRGRFATPTRAVEVAPGAVLFVPAGEIHRFSDIIEDLAALVVFAPAEGSRTRSS